MMKNKNILFIMLVILSSCHDSNKNSFVIRADCLDIVERYIADANLDDVPYLLMSTDSLTGYRGKERGFLIGPIYKKMLHELDSTKFLFLKEIHGCKLFVYSNYSRLFEKTSLNMKYHDQDSCVIYIYDNRPDTIYDKSGFVNYLKKSVLIYPRKDGVFTDNQPDTLVLPRFEHDMLIDDDHIY